MSSSVQLFLNPDKLITILLNVCKIVKPLFISVVFLLFSLFSFSLLIQNLSEASSGAQKSFDNKFNSNTDTFPGPPKFNHHTTSELNQKIGSNSNTPTSSHTSKTDNKDSNHTPIGSNSNTPTSSHTSKTDNKDSNHTPIGSNSNTPTTSLVSKTDNKDKNMLSAHKIKSSKIADITQIELKDPDCSPQFYTTDDSTTDFHFQATLGTDSKLKSDNNDEDEQVFTPAQIDEGPNLRSYHRMQLTS